VLNRSAVGCDDRVDAESGRAAAPSVMFYSHDTYGLGHLRRTLALAHFLRSQRPITQLIVTGSPLPQRFPLPTGADYLKLPSAVKVGAEQYEPRSLNVPFRVLRTLRRDLLLATARELRPSVLVVDNVPGGLKRELVPTLHHLKSVGCRVVLGLRDIVDEADWVRESWTTNGSYELLDDVYDRILVYGERSIYDVADAYRFSATAAAKTRYVGYLGRAPAQRSRDEIRRDLGIGDAPLVLVMAGGGEDGFEVLRAVLAALRLHENGPGFECLLIGGPLMPPEHKRAVLELVRKPRVRYLDFVDDVAGYLGAADAVVSMGGYNSVCELLSLRKPALIMPRVEPRREQLIRARLLSRGGFLRMIEPAEVDPRRLLDELTMLLEPSQPRSMPMRGLPAAADELDELLGARKERRAATPSERVHG